MRSAEWSRRRRRSIAILTAAVIAAVLTLGAIAFAVGHSQVSVLLLQVPVVAGILPTGLHARRAPLDRLLAVVRDAVPEGSRATIVRMRGSQPTMWLGVRGFVTPFLVLVDDDEGFALWTRRSDDARLLAHWSWSEVRSATRRDDGEGVDLRMVDEGLRMLTVLPADPEADAMGNRLQSPWRNRMLADHLESRIRGPRASGSQVDGDDRRSGDVDWLGA